MSRRLESLAVAGSTILVFATGCSIEKAETHQTSSPTKGQVVIDESYHNRPCLPDQASTPATSIFDCLGSQIKIHINYPRDGTHDLAISPLDGSSPPKTTLTGDQRDYFIIVAGTAEGAHCSINGKQINGKTKAKVEESCDPPRH